jgi:hypothetical protein
MVSNIPLSKPWFTVCCTKLYAVTIIHTLRKLSNCGEFSSRHVDSNQKFMGW